MRNRFYEADGGQGGDSGTKTVEQMQSELLELQKTIENQRIANLEIANDRKKLKEEIERVKNAELLEQGKFKEIAEKLQKEVEEYKPYKEKAESLEKTFIEIETATKNELLNSLSEEHKLIASKLTVADLKEYVKLNQKQDFNPDQRKSGQFKNSDNWDDYTLEELDKLKIMSPKKYDLLFNTKYKRS